MSRPRAVAVLTAAAVTTAFAQTIEADRRRGAEILRDVKSLLQRRYYEPSFRGLDLEARFARAQEQVRTATSDDMISGIIAQALMDLDDSHTFFIPPPLAATFDYGWKTRVVGDRCLLVEVDADSDAAAQGLGPGDEVLAVEGVRPDRTSRWKIRYALEVLRPRPQVRLTMAGAPGPRVVTVKTKVIPGQRYADFEEYLETLRDRQYGRKPSRFAEAGDVLVWKLTSFDPSKSGVGDGVKRARKAKALVLDLRGNSGGAVDVLRDLAGAFFPPEPRLTIASLRERKGQDSVAAEQWSVTRGFSGPLVVVVDSESASASEVFAATIQLRKRGQVIGDRTAGAVMVSRFHPMMQGHLYRFLPYAVSVTEAALFLPDGSSLEKTGVRPDEVALPEPEDLKAGRDPVLARAVALAGGSITPEAAAKLFPKLPEDSID